MGSSNIDTKVLKSTINQTQVRGVTQFFSTDLQHNVKQVPDEGQY
jgi:uncharacterized protein YejL (UPF0352 family)